MHLHFLGICGTFMGSLAILAREMGHSVSGSDQQVYPPMSDQLLAAGIHLHEGFDYNPEDFNPDLVIVGNVMSRGQPCVEALLESKLPYTSGPQWLHDYLLRGQEQTNTLTQSLEPSASQIEPWRWVLAVAGTHGKTTTASMLAWLLEDAGMNPGFLIGGVPANFGIPARLGGTNFFVIEADEYDTAFFDKRSKFVHYQPRTLVLNNLEFDHADIFPDLAAIQTQFHHLMRLLPANGRVIYPQADTALQAVITQGCWSEQETLGGNKADWQAVKKDAAGSAFEVYLKGEYLGEVNWSLTGEHNISNALAALAAARHVGVEPAKALESLGSFLSVKRRMELLGEVAGVQVYDDFAHHPTAIATTLEGARPGCKGRLIAVIEPRSNTMQLGTLRAALPASVELADAVYWYQSPKMSWSPQELNVGHSFTDLAALKTALLTDLKPDDWVVLMSNGSFGGLHQEIMQALTTRAAEE
ncbi:UDP-N-acetylmuramate:L-alanyl-gamma-D-glutamyl-meso-diaminopimelate ligase [Marinospirillum insulare]|uniref:UDP-N-acetylmuramate--L-alanyl-gamma-D-glutamyl-meso-2,6-diaminoheptandioate ligase n=1 Tax=Marinospirillum insulare TaxID=217169 RepID=A0ABQ5ZUF9_9GAMM|nr:UDP-N-acetylmuramate:L-alanyl-gamma-D-glutamyl-meso-diaminopimelate ligase [Marinospirillum insulare]GLR62668.1 UDP-N-acetylmuramate--L-alanyl-gamma-D-glutamyl-meso-2,6-diaminoheptandioate ligase [Marinospirillum insulare]